MKIVLVTGGFDPLHSGHIAYFKAARQLGNLLVVGINSDNWLIRKKGKFFMPAVERKAIIENIYQVHKVIEFNDDDNSAIDAINQVKKMFPRDQIVFANGGDRNKDNIPEMIVEDVEFVFGVGGEDKKNSSSWILEEWKAPKVDRPWGHYRVIYQSGDNTKVKELVVNPGKSLSMQRHSERAEHWFVAEGRATVYTVNVKSDFEVQGVYEQFQHIHILRTQWHQLANETNEPLKIVEIQYGNNCIEEDIERK